MQHLKLKDLLVFNLVTRAYIGYNSNKGNFMTKDKEIIKLEKIKLAKDCWLRVKKDKQGNIIKIIEEREIE